MAFMLNLCAIAQPSSAPANALANSGRAKAVESVTIPSADELEKNFTVPPDDAKPWVFMWWYGKITPADITLHLEALNAKGVGGVLLFDHGAMPGVPFISDAWRELFRHTVREADRLGLKMGVNVCAHWPSGGRWITPENSSWMVVSSETILKGPQNFSGKIAEPNGKGKLYADESVQAFPVSEEPSNQRPLITVSANPSAIPNLVDGNYNTVWKSGTTGEQWILVDFGTPHVVDWAWIDLWDTVKLEASEDGHTFKPVAELTGPRRNLVYQAIPSTTARWFRIVVPNNSVIRDFALGTKFEVEQTALLAAKRALTNPLGVTTTHQGDQVAFVRNDLKSLPNNQPLKTEAMIDLTAKCSPDGTLNWTVPPGTWKIIRIGRTTTGIRCGDGLLTDYLGQAATEQNYDNALKLLVKDVGPLVGKTFEYFHEDNVEIGGTYSWTPKLTEEFRQRRGYDPTPYLSAMAGDIVGSAGITDRFLTDVRRTIADCVADWHYRHWAELAHADGMKVRAEAGGQHHPRLLCNDGLMNQGRMDVPVAEFWTGATWKENQWVPTNHHAPQSTEWEEAAQDVNAKQTASAAHLYGKPIVASESFTDFKMALWGSAPADLLRYANVAFCEGINAMTIHGSATSGLADGKPGKAFSAGTQFNQNLTWWDQSGAFLTYLARCQYLLQRGLFVADVLYYNGDEAPNFVPPKNIDPSRGFGYDYDVCNSEILLTRLSVKDGRIVLPDGMSYRVLVLPDRPVMPLAVAEKIKELVQAGVTVIGPKPQRTPGLTDYPQSEQELKIIADQVWGTDAATEHTFGQGHVVSGSSIREVLTKNGVMPDFAYKSETTNALVDFIHRRDGDTEIYFVINRRNTNLCADFSFRVSSKQPELWNPVTGERREATAFKHSNGQITLPLELAAYGSLFVIFKKPVATDGKADRNFALCQPLQTLNGDWQVQFDPKWGGPEHLVTFAGLPDWTTRPEDGIKYYSGTATYRKTFNLDAANLNPGHKLYLNLGEVKNVATVRLNGKNLGVVWCAPWWIEISETAMTGENHLEIDVVNLWPNRLKGDENSPEEKRLTKVWISGGDHKGKFELLPSGLLGPVQILSAQTLRE